MAEWRRKLHHSASIYPTMACTAATQPPRSCHTEGRRACRPRRLRASPPASTIRTRGWCIPQPSSPQSTPSSTSFSRLPLGARVLGTNFFSNLIVSLKMQAVNSSQRDLPIIPRDFFATSYCHKRLGALAGNNHGVACRGFFNCNFNRLFAIEYYFRRVS